jgi:hypothetical protein
MAGSQYLDQVAVGYLEDPDTGTDPDFTSYNIGDPTVDENDKLIVRFQVENSGNKDAGSDTWQLYYNSTNNPATASQVTTVNTDIQITDDGGSNNIADGAVCDAQRCGSNANTWMDGEYRDNSDDTSKHQILQSYYTEFAWHVQFLTTGTWYLWMRVGDTALDGHAAVMTVTVNAASGDKDVPISSPETLTLAVLSPTPLATVLPSAQSLTGAVQTPVLEVKSLASAQSLSLAVETPIPESLKIPAVQSLSAAIVAPIPEALIPPAIQALTLSLKTPYVVPSNDLNTDLEFYYACEDNTSTSKVTDEKGSYDGTIVNDQNNYSSEQSTASGKNVRGFDMDGANDSIAAANSLQSMLRGDFTFALHLNLDDGQLWQAPFGAADAPYDNYISVEVQANGKVSFAYGANGNTATATTLNSILPNGATGWFSLIVRGRSGIGGPNGLQIYKDGIVQTLDPAADGDTSNITFGDYTNTYAPHFMAFNDEGTVLGFVSGIIDEVGAWSRALDDDEIAVLASQPLFYPFSSGDKDVPISAAETLTLTIQTPTPIVQVVVSAQSITAAVQTPIPKVDVSPSALALSLGILSPTPALDSFPSAQNITASIPSPITEVRLEPTGLTLTLTVESPSVKIDAQPQPSAQSLTLAVLAPTIITGTVVQPSAVPLTLSLESSTLQIDSTEVVSSAQTITATLPPPVPVVVQSPSELAMSLSVSAPSILVDKSVSAQTLSLSILTPTIDTTGDKTIIPNTITMSLSVLVPSIQIIENILVQPDALNMSLTVLQPIIRVNIQPSVLTLGLSVETSSPGVTILPTAQSLTLEQPVLDKEVLFEAAALAMSAAVLSPTVVIPGLVTAAIYKRTISARRTR